MKRLFVITLALFVVALVSLSAQTGKGWVTLFDGKNLDNFNVIGTANWKIADGAVEANSGTGFLVTKQSYSDFDLRLEFWVSEDANSGVFFRAQDANKIADTTAYEANIYDKRPDPSYRTGGIVHTAKPMSMINAGGHWNTYEISARGPKLTVILNDTKTVDVEDKKYARGPIALQYGAGTVRFRNVQIRPVS
jgi:hypothetical protein